MAGKQERLAGKKGCIRRKTGRLGQAGRKDRLYKKEDRQAGAGRQAETKRRAMHAGNTTVPIKMRIPANTSHPRKTPNYQCVTRCASADERWTVEGYFGLGV